MQLPIEEIFIKERLRQDAGDVTGLMESIRNIGLINPVVVSEHNELISGFRRLQACKQLGWKYIHVRRVSVGNDDLSRLEMEFHENVGREGLNEEETARYQERKNQLLHPEPESRFRAFIIKIWSPIRNWIRKLFKI
jgi:ParB family chromosome partitioning protein